MATALFLAAIAAGCSSLPWKNEPNHSQVAIAFTIDNNLLFLPSATLNGHPGRFLLGSALPTTVLDKEFASRAGDQRPFVLTLSERETLRLLPLILDLRGSGDAIIGADAWGGSAVTIDYAKGILTYQKEGIHSELMTRYSFAGPPAISVAVDGRNVTAIVDTTSPDTLVLPRSRRGRGKAEVVIAGETLGIVDVGYAAVDEARIGNRLLANYLITIDYGRRQVGLFRDVRTKPKREKKSK